MTPGDLLWLFFMFSALQPVLRQRFLEASRARLIAGSSASAGRESSFSCTARRP